MWRLSAELKYGGERLRANKYLLLLCSLLSFISAVTSFICGLTSFQPLLVLPPAQLFSLLAFVFPLFSSSLQLISLISVYDGNEPAKTQNLFLRGNLSTRHACDDFCQTFVIGASQCTLYKSINPAEDRNYTDPPRWALWPHQEEDSRDKRRANAAYSHGCSCPIRTRWDSGRT